MTWQRETRRAESSKCLSFEPGYLARVEITTQTNSNEMTERRTKPKQIVDDAPTLCYEFDGIYVCRNLWPVLAPAPGQFRLSNLKKNKQEKERET